MILIVLIEFVQKLDLKLKQGISQNAIYPIRMNSSALSIFGLLPACTHIITLLYIKGLLQLHNDHLCIS